MSHNFVYKKVYDETAKKWCITPNTLTTQNTFLILSNSEEEADQIITDLKAGTVSEPQSVSAGWKKLGEMPNPERTPIFEKI